MAVKGKQNQEVYEVIKRYVKGPDIGDLIGDLRKVEAFKKNKSYRETIEALEECFDADPVDHDLETPTPAPAATPTPKGGKTTKKTTAKATTKQTKTTTPPPPPPYKMFMRFYGVSDGEIDICLAQMLLNGHKFTETRKPIQKSINVVVPANSVEVWIEFQTYEELVKFKDDKTAKSIYLMFNPKSATFENRQPGDVAFSI